MTAHRKTNKSNLEHKRPLLFLIGMTITLSCSYAALHIKFFTKSTDDMSITFEDPFSHLTPAVFIQIIPPKPNTTAPIPNDLPLFSPKNPHELPALKVNQLIKPVNELTTKSDVALKTRHADQANNMFDQHEGKAQKIQPLPLMTFISHMPTYPSCSSLKSNMERKICTEKLIQKQIQTNFKMPIIAQEIGLEDVIYLQFIVNEKGVIGHVKILKGAHQILNDEAVRAVSMLPPLNPGMNLGQAAAVTYTIPIRITQR